MNRAIGELMRRSRTCGAFRGFREIVAIHTMALNAPQPPPPPANPAPPVTRDRSSIWGCTSDGNHQPVILFVVHGAISGWCAIHQAIQRLMWRSLACGAFRVSCEIVEIHSRLLNTSDRLALMLPLPKRSGIDGSLCVVLVFVTLVSNFQ
jgi:hypothetical protein